jgi:hypothetical protein
MTTSSHIAAASHIVLVFILPRALASGGQSPWVSALAEKPLKPSSLPKPFKLIIKAPWAKARTLPGLNRTRYAKSAFLGARAILPSVIKSTRAPARSLH